MIPILFKKNEQQFRTYGLGEITDIINPKVTRERNGQYNLYFQYPQEAEFSGVFEEEMRIKSDAGVRTEWQTFEISRVLRKEGQLIEVFAKHISQSLSKDALNPEVNVSSSTAEQALRIWNNNRIGDETFDVQSDITTTNSTSWHIGDVSNAFEALAGTQGSILDVWGGEYEFDNKMIRLHREMGRKAPIILEYGRNIIGIEQDNQDDNVYTSVYPFATYIPEGADDLVTVTIPERYVDGKYLDMHSKRKIQVVDFSAEFDRDNPPTVERIRTLANQYANANEVGLPHEKLTVEYVDLSKTLDYQEFQVMEEVELNDTLPIFYPKFGVTNENAKVVVVNYNPIKEENISIELGVIGQSFRTIATGGIGSRLDRIEKQQSETNNYIINSKGNRIWFETPDENMEHKIGDTWFEENGQYTRIRVWNGSQWETIIDSEDIDKNAKDIATQQQDIEEAKQTADEAVEQIDTAVANAGFTSLDDTLQNMNYITMNAEQRAQQAITDAGNAYGLAQTSISEAQTAQANSLTALGKADNALDGVSDLDIRVDEVEAELELKADNTFMNEDGTLTTLSNAITFNAHRFSSDMSRIESRVESLAGEINLVILRNAFENTWLIGGEVYPNPTARTGADTMNEMINVVAGEELALSKNTVSGDNAWRINFYGNSHNYVTRVITADNQYILTVPAGATKMWVSYPTDSQPQIVRGTSFIPYRPNLADQMTTEEITVFRNEYDEFADKTERRLSSIDSSDGRLATAEFLITQTANGLALKADQTTVNELTGEIENLGTEFDIVAGQVSSKVWMADIDEIEVGGRNYFSLSKLSTISASNDWVVYSYFYEFYLEPDTNYIMSSNVPNDGVRVMYFNENSADNAVHLDNSPIVKSDENGYLYVVIPAGRTHTGKVLDGSYWVKLEKGNKATDWTPAPEDTDAKINHIETEWTQTFESFEQTITGEGGINAQLQTLENSLSSIADPVTGRLSVVEQTASGLQSEVYNADGSSKVTQLATGLSSVVTDLGNLEIGGRNLVLDSKNKTFSGNNSTRELIQGRAFQLSESTIIGETYTVTIKARTTGYSPLVELWLIGSQKFIEFTHNPDMQEYSATFTAQLETTTIHMYGQYVRFIFVDWIKIEKGNKATDWTPAPEDVQSQISQLSDNINLRVTKGDVINQINISDENILIDGKKLLINSDTVINGTAWMDGAVIKNASMDGAKIQDATIGSAKIANLDVSKISGNTSNFVQSNWNSLSTSVSINSTGITVSNSGNTIQAILRDGIIEFKDNTSNIVGGMAVAEIIDQSTRYKGIITHANYDKFWAVNKQWNAGGGYGPVIRTAIREPGLEIHVGTRIFGTLNMGGNEIHSVDRLYMGNTVEGIIRVPAENSIAAVASGGIRLAVGTTGTGGYSTKLLVTNTTVRVDANLETTGFTSLNNTLNMNRKQIHSVERIYMGDTTNGLGVSGGRPFLDGSTGVYLSYGNNMRIDVLDTVIRFYGQLDMNGNTITGQSDYRLKRDIKATELNSLVAIESWKIVGFNWIDDEMNERNGRQLGVIAQDTPDLAMYNAETDTWSINSSKQIMMNTHAIQQLALREENTNLVASQALQATESNESKIHKLQQELSKANRRIEELESVM